ncbi:MaoC/PaaZ C-terminal domain-containing protein [Celeribacter litoreus]|uniref:MaoC/PaaZ C-terminal domain-containing protein n=1 Tax=Celeribacter litoreus TaxID=2876714 RepID=UPI001CCBD2B9|nr:MaoC/PaaZ C-terminal domain-containing protein [Celeribacter litoreus]MCA0043373.1 MaoC family dehydratase N-terminal domain-containing protein [Celeribacter litoreus]
MATEPRGKYYEDFTVGEAFETPRRTVTNTDIVNFACLSGDFNEVHTNWEYAKNTPFGEPIAHAPLIYAIMGGLNYAAGVNDGTLLAVIGIDEWRMLKPVLHGDTVHMRSTVLEKRLTSKPGRGVVKVKREFMNQRDEVVQTMMATFMYKCRPEA